MRWRTNCYDFWFKWTATAAIGIHPTKAWLSQLVNFKNAIRHFRRTIYNKTPFKLRKMPQKRMECFRPVLDHVAWIEHQFLSDIRDSRKAGSLWEMMKSVGGVRKSLHQSWLAKGLGLGLLCWGFKEAQEEIPSEEPALFKSGQWRFHQDNAPVHSSILVTDYLAIMTVSHTPYSLDLAPCDFGYSLIPEAIVMRQLRRWRAVTKIIDTLTQEDFHGAF